MAKCIREGGTAGGPNTHRATVHLSICPHSTLRETTQRHRPKRLRPVPGTRRIVIDDAELYQSR